MGELTPLVNVASSAELLLPAKLERENRALRRENEDLRQQRSILEKSTPHCLGSPARRHGVIRSLANEFPVKALCRALGVSRSGYYAAQRKAERPRSRESLRLGVKIKESFETRGRTYGSPRLAVVLRRGKETCGRHRVARLMRVHRLRATQKRHFRPRAIGSRHLCLHRPQPPGRTARPAHPSERGLADGHHLRRHQGRLALRGQRARCLSPQDGGMGGG